MFVVCLFVCLENINFPEWYEPIKIMFVLIFLEHRKARTVVAISCERFRKPCNILLLETSDFFAMEI